jgi:hypothetical protein
MSLINWFVKRVVCDESHGFYDGVCNAVIVFDIVVDAKCEIMLAYHNKSQLTTA